MSKSRVDRAGEALRKWVAAEDAKTREAILDEAVKAYRTAQDWRRSLSYPLALVTPGVRNWVDQESDQMVVAQRLKRMPQIINKPMRFDTMRLSQMEGGSASAPTTARMGSREPATERCTTS